MCLTDNMRLGHIVQSYMSKISLSFTACREAIPDPDFYGDCIRKSFEDHMQAVKVLEKRKAAQKTTKTAPAKKAPAPKKAKPKPTITEKSVNGSSKTIN